MSALWFPGADLSRRTSLHGGSIVSGRPKLVWHDTETNGIPGYSTGYFPHLTVYGGEVYQHIPVNYAARALRHPSGTPHTNRANVIQVEIVGWVDKIQYHPILRQIALWAHEHHNVPLNSKVDWLPYDGGSPNGSYGRSRVRMTWDEWMVFSGHCGHQHVPGNDHGDPGWPFPIDKILHGADMPLDAGDKEFIESVVERIVVKARDEGVRMTAHGQPDGDANREFNNFKIVHTRINELENIIAELESNGIPVTVDYDILADKVVERLEALRFTARIPPADVVK